MKHVWLTLAAVSLPVLADDAVLTTPGLTVAQAAAESSTGSGAARTTRSRATQPAFLFGADDLLLEAGTLPDASETDAAATLRASAFVLWQPDRSWEIRAGARVDGASQYGGAAEFNQWRADYMDTYARWRGGDTRLTFGAQTVVWGRVDAIPLIDRVSRADLTRAVLDDLPDRRRAQLALRWEETLGDYKLDTVLLPVFRGAQLPDVHSVWSPINRQTGEVFGLAPSPTLAALVRTATINEDDDGAGGGAVRLTRTGVAPVDFGLTLARTRQSQPYYEVDPVAPSLTGIHPYNTFAGADVEFVTGGLTWRSELGLTDGIPATLPTGQMITTRALEWVGAVEFFPGGGDTRVNLQLAARALRTDQTVLELKEYYGINGEVETTLEQGRWRLSARFLSGLNVHDVYVSPKLSYLGWEPHEIYVVGHYFDGEDRTLGGFHRNHGMVAVGLNTRF